MQRFAFDLLDSTNLEARRLWVQAHAEASTPTEPIVVVAARQSAGMGRAGRDWISPEGGLWLSLAWPLRDGLEAYLAMPLVVGLATALALEALYGLSCRIKWPNDILVEGRKLVGILCQSELRVATPMIVAGVGINANFPATVLGSGLRQPPTSLLDVLGHPVDLHELEGRLVESLIGQLTNYERGCFEPEQLPAIRDHLAWLGEAVCCTEPSGRVLAEGRLVDLDATGCLVIETPEGRVALAVGEVHLSSSG